MRFLVDWQVGAKNVALEERATIADLQLFIDQQNVCLHLAGNDSVDHLTISLYPLVEGLVHDWWSLFGARDSEFSLLKHRSGYAVPDIRLSYDGAVFQISAHQRTYRNPDVRFWAGPSEIMNRADAEAQLSLLIEQVLERLVGAGIAETSATLRWARIQASRKDADEAEFCESAGALGLDPYSLDDAAADAIERASELFEGEPLTEFLAGGRNNNPRQLINWVSNVERRPRHQARVSELRNVAAEVAGGVKNRDGEESWSLGYRRARGLRTALALAENHRFKTYRQLAEMLGASPSYRTADPVDGIRLLRSDQDDGCYIHMRTQMNSPDHQSSHLFTFARGVADVVCFPEPQKAPVNDLHSAYRQAAGRAFAAEFVAPVNEILAMWEDKRDVASIAAEFSVSTQVIERQLENAQRVESACAA